MIICLRWTTLLPANGIVKQSLLVSDFCTKRQKLKKKKEFQRSHYRTLE